MGLIFDSPQHSVLYVLVKFLTKMIIVIILSVLRLVSVLLLLLLLSRFSRVRPFATPWTVHGILQARTMEWVAIPFSRGSSQPRDQTRVSCIPRRFFTI